MSGVDKTWGLTEQGHRGPVPTVCKADGGVDRQNTERGGLGQGWRGNQGRSDLRGNTQRGLERVCPWSKEGLVQSIYSKLRACSWGGEQGEMEGRGRQGRIQEDLEGPRAV